MKIVGIIPARYDSKRLFAKPLININNKPLIQLTYEAAFTSRLFDAIYIATDSKKIKNITDSFGANCILTKKEHRNGTERCCELITILNTTVNNEDLIINIQCDEPFLKKSHFQTIIQLFNTNTEIGTLISPIHKDEVSDKSIVKVKTNNKLTIKKYG